MLRLIAAAFADGSKPSSGGGCPVLQDAKGAPPASSASSAAASGCPVMHGDMQPPAAAAAATSGCPVLAGDAAASSSATVSAMLNPLNRMPVAAQQQHGIEQAGDLSKHRVESTIPKGTESGNWVYPSPQMFYNALVKKGKAKDVDEKDMTSVVAIHNNMNETTWKRVLEWEELHCDECTAARKLVRFVGRPDELTPKAALQYYLGLSPRPFDRHDWTVDRCGKEVRYLIDYYDVADKRADDRLPALHDEDAVPSIYCDVRPAGDNVGELMDRARMLVPGLAARLSSLATVAAKEEPAAASASASAASHGDSNRDNCDDAGTTASVLDAVRSNCADRMAALQACDSEAACARAHIGLTLCIAQHVCAPEAEAFAALKGAASERSDEAAARFGAMEDCVAKWGQAAQAADAQA